MTVHATIAAKGLLIHGDYVPARSGRYFETTDPATGALIAHIAEADAHDVDAAVPLPVPPSRASGVPCRARCAARCC